MSTRRTQDRLALLGFGLMVIGAGMLSWSLGEHAADWVFTHALRSSS